MQPMDHVSGRFSVKAIEDSGSFAGYGSVYGVLDYGDDIIAPGAFSESVQRAQQSGVMPALLWQHKAAEPIGAYTLLREDDHGLYVEGRLALRTQRGLEAYELMRMQALSGLSVGFQTRADSFDAKTGVRTIRKGDLWEVSLVTFPMNDHARVHTMKSLASIGDVRGAERYLREHLGLSRAQAKGFVARVLGLARREVDASPPSQGSKARNQALDAAVGQHTEDEGLSQGLSQSGMSESGKSELDKPDARLDWDPIVQALKVRLALLNGS